MNTSCSWFLSPRITMKVHSRGIRRPSVGDLAGSSPNKSVEPEPEHPRFSSSAVYFYRDATMKRRITPCFAPSRSSLAPHRLLPHAIPPSVARSRRSSRGGLITPVFQPIISLSDGTILGYEALSRMTRPGLLANSEALFAKAVQYGLTARLEMLCRRSAIVRARELELTGRLFLNVCPSLLLASDHERGATAAFLDEMGLNRSDITFELTERTLIEDYGLFRRVLSYYRGQGYSMAIDDLGSGYAGLKMLSELEPEYVKLSSYLIRDIDRSETKQALVDALVTLCGRIGSRVIAEGIESAQELGYLKKAGVTLGQGYFLARPSENPGA